MTFRIRAVCNRSSSVRVCKSDTDRPLILYRLLIFECTFICRIKQCVEINHNHLVTLHHELGHIQYYLQYWNLSYSYRTGANPGFHEAVGDLMSLSVDTPTHLQNLGLLKNYKSDNGRFL